ncbi:MAG TPA: hypothetical protein VGR89_06930 [Puia sp.]|nr:hypothetical protein [Puia sp.]
MFILAVMLLLHRSAASGDFSPVRNPGQRPGLSVLPVEHEDFRTAQHYHEAKLVCCNCGKTVLRSAKPCEKWGNKAFEHPMV